MSIGYYFSQKHFIGQELEDVGGEEELSKVLSSRNKAREGDRQRVNV